MKSICINPLARRALGCTVCVDWVEFQGREKPIARTQMQRSRLEHAPVGSEGEGIDRFACNDKGFLDTPVFASHAITLPSKSPLTIVSPSREKVSECSLDVCPASSR